MQIATQLPLEGMNIPANQSMLLVLPLPFHTDQEGQLLIESQGLNGLKCWLKHFSPLTLAAPVRPKREQSMVKNATWVPVPDAFYQRQFQMVALPWGYHPFVHIKQIRSVQKKLRPLIQEHRYLQFGISGCTFGDWAAVAGRLAIREGRPYAVHTDWITHQVYKHNARQLNFRRKLRAIVEGSVMRYAEHRIIKRSGLGLFHGADTYEGYRNWCDHPFMIHDAQVQPGELKPLEQVKIKMASVVSNRPLKIVYAGRAIAMKGPEHWIKALSIVRDAGVDFEAKWYGTGDMIKSMQQQINTLNLQDRVTLPGHLANRDAMLKAVYDADMLLFCHLTPESPRILIESMSQATPIVGYGSNYSAQLTEQGGGQLIELGKIELLAQQIIELNQNRSVLQKLMGEVRQCSEALTDVRVFGERAQLIRDYLA